MKEKLRELMGQPNVWLHIKSSNGWVRNAEILEVTDETLTFRYEHETDIERRFWEKTTRIENISEIDVKLVAYPKENRQLDDLKSKLEDLYKENSH